MWQNSIHESTLTTTFGQITEPWLSNLTPTPNRMGVCALLRDGTNDIYGTIDVLRISYFDHMLKYEERQALYTYLKNYYGF